MFNSILLHIPHGSTTIPKSFGQITPEVEEAINVQTDSFTKELFISYLEPNKIKSLPFGYSRQYCDVERYWDDELEEMSKVGQGVFYTKLSNGVDNNRKDSKGSIKRHYERHHKLLNDISSDLISKHSSCLIIDCHSFNDNISEKSPDICLGVNDLETFDKQTLTMIVEHFESHKLSVEINFPYSGAMYPSEFKHENLQSIMIEVNKNLYLNGEYGFDVNIEGFEFIQNIIQELYSKILRK